MLIFGEEMIFRTKLNKHDKGKNIKTIIEKSMTAMSYESYLKDASKICRITK